MNEINHQAITTYQNNLQYFQKNHPQLYQRLNALENNIANNIYQEQYSLEYKDGYFDARNLITNEWLYGMNSIDYSESITDALTLSKQGSIFEGQRFIGYHPQMLAELDEMPLEFKNGYWGAIKPIYYNFEYANKETTRLKEINKVLFLDVRLGLHLSSIIQKFHSRYIFVYEKGLEVFRLSLFTTSYSEMAKSCKFYFSIEDNESESKENFLPFIQENNQFNLYIKHITLTQDYFEDLQKLQLHIFSQDYMQYSYATLLLNYIDSPYYLQQSYSYLNVSHKYLNSIFSKKPVLLLFSGPSTLKNIEFIKKEKDKFIIVSPLSACKLLHKFSITPDIVMHIDPQDEQSLLLTYGIEKEFFKKSLFLFSSTVHKHVTQYFTKENTFIIPNMQGFKKDFYALTANSVGEYTYALMLLFDVKKLYLLGIDMALDAQTLQTHNEYHHASKVGKNDTNIITQKISYVPGNFRPLAPTTSEFTGSLEHFKVFSSVLKDVSQEAFNLSDGAKLNGCEPLHAEELDTTSFEILDKSDLHNILKDFFYSIGSNEFREVDKDLIRYQINRASHLLKIVKKYKGKTYNNSEEYLANLLKLSSKLTEANEGDQLLSKIYRYYLQMIPSYIFDIFNTQELIDETKHIKNIDTILLKELQRIGNLFIDRLKKYLE
ncbi:MAG: hypothetical protein ACI9TV_001117 [Sulfurimonas sp.]|jgi:hypothetical protein|uniref:6-hydroxymethylpterin diphosphokinase MptE-like protein n=1 Tax=Sulfurimonas sp. TaxID=2022749 RepID=UPI0039E6503C